MNAEPTIREVNDADQEALIALWNAAGVARAWNDPARDIAFARRDAHSTILVAEIDGLIVASVMVGEDGHRGWVYYVAAAPGLQGQGHGRAIMLAAEAFLREQGVPKVELMVRSDNLAARGFYDRLGYSTEDVVVMSRRLAAN